MYCRKGNWGHSDTIAHHYLIDVLGYNLDKDFLLGYGGLYNPDFVMRDGTRWEAKLLTRQGTTAFTYLQTWEYSQIETNVIGVYKNDVIFVKPFSELKPFIRKTASRLYILDTRDIFSLLINYEYKMLIKKRREEVIEILKNDIPISGNNHDPS